MPIYEYRCEECAADHEMLRPVGAEPPEGGCPDCGGALRKRFSRVAVRYEGWGFKATDSLVSDPGGKDFKALRDRAERISEGGD
jgi:putative FmdB family regulatory protein